MSYTDISNILTSHTQRHFDIITLAYDTTTLHAMTRHNAPSHNAPLPPLLSTARCDFLFVGILVLLARRNVSRHVESSTFSFDLSE